MHLDGVPGQIAVPFLICHGENEQTTGSPKRELRVFTAELVG